MPSSKYSRATHSSNEKSTEVSFPFLLANSTQHKTKRDNDHL